MPVREVNHVLDREPEADERLIVALDFNNRRDALRLVDQLEGAVSFFKVGLELFVAEGSGVVKELQARGHKVFLDLKIDDVVETITRTVREIAKLNVDFLTINGSGATAAAAWNGRGESPLPKIMLITLLTSLDGTDLSELNLVGGDRPRFASVDAYVEWRARKGLENRCDEFITSGQNVRPLRERFASQSPILICPGIRPAGVGHHEHKRASTPLDAVKNGADYIVVGRPIRDADNPGEAAKRIIDDIAKGYAQRDF